MQAIRLVNPRARLIQRDDLGKTHSTPFLRYQADFENERRWLAWDLLCGRVNEEHALWSYFAWAGDFRRELAWFQEHPCPPDILGVDYYLTSERWLDERIESYPAATHGSNERHRYADVEAIRVCPAENLGLSARLREIWARYRLPIAVTELHLGCTREEQLRWFKEGWDTVRELHTEGMDIRALTAWGLLGFFDWHTLLTRREDHYEPGAFDVRGSAPRPTAMAHLVRQLAHGETPDHPLYEEQGWWQRKERLLPHLREEADDREGAGEAETAQKQHHSLRKSKKKRFIALLGLHPMLRSAFENACHQRGLDYCVYPLPAVFLDERFTLLDPAEVEQLWSVIMPLEPLYREPSADEGDRWDLLIQRLITAAAHRRISLLALSSSRVFDGSLQTPRSETDAVAPFGAYGQKMAENEHQLLNASLPSLIVRTGPLYAEHQAFPYRPTFPDGKPPAGYASHQTHRMSVSPTLLHEFAHLSLDLLIDQETGIWHLVNEGDISW